MMPNSRKSRCSAIALAMAVLAVFTWCGCAVSSSAPSDDDGRIRYVVASDLPTSDSTDSAPNKGGETSGANPADRGDAKTSEAPPDVNAVPTYPIGWLAFPSGEIPTGVPIAIRHLPEMDTLAHRGGKAVSEDDQSSLDEALPEAGEDQAVVEYNGELLTVDASAVLVNLPDVLPQVEYDIVYSYAATSACDGQPIPGVTGIRLEGYAEGKQANSYLNVEQFAVPCAYRTALKVQTVCEQLDEQGLRLLVYDAYRPMAAQRQLSDAFEQACSENETITESLGAWSMTWYVASGASGHNYGTDLDVGVCKKDGTPLPMPSAFDAFDESGHLTNEPMDAASITPESYREAVSGNDACLALHAAFTEAGFEELASEWWHFGDRETETEMRAIIGDQGLGFVAVLE